MSYNENAAWVAQASIEAEEALGRPLDAATLKLLEEMRKEFSAAELRLEADLDSGLLTLENCPERITEIMKASVEKFRSLLGDEAFAATFGELRLCPERLVDAQDFADQPTASIPAPKFTL